MEKIFEQMIINIENFWKIFERKEYISKIEKYLDTNLIKVLVWERRVWKSFLMRSFIKNILEDKDWKNNSAIKNIFYINFEIDDFFKLKKYENIKKFFDENFLSQINKNEKIFVFLDEVQELENWQVFVNSILAKFWENVEIFITWSNSKLLSWELATYLSWRYIEFLILPFSFEEFKEFTWNKNILDYLKSTWLPEALKLQKLDERELLVNYFKSLKDTLLLKDIIERYKIKDAYLLEKIFLFLVDNISNFSSLNSIVKKIRQEWIKTNHVTLWNYIKYLEQSFLIFSLQKYDLKWKRFFENEKKYYLNDLWFKNFLTSNYDLWLSKTLENYIFLILKRKWYQIYIWWLKNWEIDFIWEKWWKKIYVQVCINLENENVFKREIDPFFLIPEKENFYLVTIWENFLWNYKWINIVDVEWFEKFS